MPFDIAGSKENAWTSRAHPPSSRAARADWDSRRPDGWRRPEPLSRSSTCPPRPGASVAEELGGSFAAADVTDPEQVAAAVAQASEAGPLRVVVNCAGIAPPAKVLDREGNPSPLADFERIVRINLVGTYNVIAQASAAIAKTEPTDGGDRGVIVSTASVAAFDGQIGQPAYSASKGGVHAMTLPIARELARYGIRVLTIAPGIMETPMLKGLPQAAQDSLGEQVPYPQRLGRPDEYAKLVLSIIDNGYLNGETIRLDGAIRMAPKYEEQHDRLDPRLARRRARPRDVQPARVPQRDGLRDGRAVARCRARAHVRPRRRSDHPGCRGPGLLRGRRRHRDGDVPGDRARTSPRAAHVIHDGIRTFVQSDKPIVAAVQGAVAGGGLGLMLTADYIVASDSAKFVSRYANIGLTPDLGVSTLLPAAIGQRRALQLLLQDTRDRRGDGARLGARRRGRAGAPRWPRAPRRSPGSGSTTPPAAFGQAKRLVRDRRRPDVRRRTSPTRRPRSAPASTPTNPAPASPRSPRHPPSPPADLEGPRA